MAAFLYRFFGDRQGAVAIVLALLLPVLVGMITLGVEGGLWFAERRELQTAADSAALAGAWELMDGNAAGVTAAAQIDAARNGFDAVGGASIEVNTPPLSGAYVGNADAVEVLVSRPQTLLFSALFMNALTVGARAVAQVGGQGDVCVLALEQFAGSAAEFTGSATVDLTGCGVAANSSSSQALAVSGSATLIADFIQTVGGYDVSGSGVLDVDATRTGTSPIADPYADLMAPAAGACTKTEFKANKTETINPGTYCKGMDITAQANVTFNPGVYIIKGGTVKINGQATVSGTGVTIILTGDAGGYAQMDINGGANVNLVAPTTGTWAGISVFQDRNAPTGDNKFNGGSTMEFTGALYFPAQEVKFTGGNQSGGGCTRIVAKLVTFTGNADLDNQCEGTGVAAIGAGGRPRLVE